MRKSSEPRRTLDLTLPNRAQCPGDRLLCDLLGGVGVTEGSQCEQPETGSKQLKFLCGDSPLRRRTVPRFRAMGHDSRRTPTEGQAGTAEAASHIGRRTAPSMLHRTEGINDPENNEHETTVFAASR